MKEGVNKGFEYDEMYANKVHYKFRTKTDIDLFTADWLWPKRNYDIDNLKSIVINYYAGLNDYDKYHFEKAFTIRLGKYVNGMPPLMMQYDEFKKFYHQCYGGEFWNIEPTHPVFGTASNERFFNYVMARFKDDGITYKQKTLSYMYWVMVKVINTRPMYIRYVNEYYAKELNPIERIKGRPQLEGEKKVEEYNQVFTYAQSNWNEENPLYIKKFDILWNV